MDADLRLGSGIVLELAESDYLYGSGPLALRVVEGPDVGPLPQLEWLRIVGRRVLGDGSETPCDVVVRVSAIQHALRPATWRPPRYRKG
jgi:hypothetical protein